MTRMLSIRDVRVVLVDDGPVLDAEPVGNGDVLEWRYRAGPVVIDAAFRDRAQTLANLYLPCLDGHPPLFYQEAADALNVSVRTLQRGVSSGRFPAHVLGKRTVFHPEDIATIRAIQYRAARP